MLSRELAPVRSVAASLERRNPDDISQIDIDVQSELRPLVRALNGLFGRIETMIRRERDFIANAAHELRTPLAGLSIQAQVANNARQPEARAHALAQLRKGIQRTSRLVDQLLLLFKIESGEKETDRKSGFRLEPVVWSELAAESIEDVEGGLEGKNIHLTLRDESHGALIQGQRELLTILLRNLLGNAAKYTPAEGKIEITLSRTEMVIRNNCPELTPKDAARLGGRFFRPPGQVEAGSGLGLSIAGKIAEIHGVELSVQTVSGMFEVKLKFI